MPRPPVYGIPLGHNATLGAHNEFLGWYNFHYSSPRGAIIPHFRTCLVVTVSKFGGLPTFQVCKAGLSTFSRRIIPVWSGPPPSNVHRAMLLKVDEESKAAGIFDYPCVYVSVGRRGIRLGLAPHARC